jgi:hypothetical protein
MKKPIVGLAAFGAVVALRPVVKRRMVQKMREHCKQMMGQSAAGSETTGNESIGPEAMHQKMRGHCEQMASHDEERSGPVARA